MKHGSKLVTKAYQYTTLWRRADAEHFRLAGALAARPGERGVYFPNDPDSQREWDRHEGRWKNGVSQEGDLEWLNAVVSSGNGVVEGFDEVRRIEATSLHEALRSVYLRTAEEQGEVIQQFEPVLGNAFKAKGDPYTSLFPPFSLGAGEARKGDGERSRQDLEERLIDAIFARPAITAEADEEGEAGQVEMPQEYTAYA